MFLFLPLFLPTTGIISSLNMLLPVWLLLFTTSLAYQVMEFDNPHCTYNKFSSRHLAHLDVCAELNTLVASSILVKVDNLYDDQRELNVYDRKDCTGEVVATISNLNGCMDLDTPGNDRVGMSVKVTSKSTSTLEKEPTSKGFDAVLTHNLNFPTSHRWKDMLAVPVSYGVFRIIKISDCSDDGTCCDGTMEMFCAKSLEGLLAPKAKVGSNGLGSTFDD